MFPARTKVIMVIACGVGIAAGALTYLASRSLPQALLTAGAATGSSADLLRQFIGAEPGHSASDRRNNQDDEHDGIDAAIGSITPDPAPNPETELDI
jgi:hypothetical protein